VTAEVRTVAASANVRVIGSPPIVGAALLALDQLDADEGARARVRRELGSAVAELEGGSAGAAVDRDGIPIDADRARTSDG